MSVSTSDKPKLKVRDTKALDQKTSMWESFAPVQIYSPMKADCKSETVY